MTDNEIIKALEDCKNAKATCDRCKLFSIKRGGMHCVEDAFDLINRLQARTKEQGEKIVIQKGCIDWQLKEINRQKAEIEKLCIEIDDLIIAKDLLFDEAEALTKKPKLMQSKSLSRG